MHHIFLFFFLFSFIRLPAVPSNEEHPCLMRILAAWCLFLFIRCVVSLLQFNFEHNLFFLKWAAEPRSEPELNLPPPGEERSKERENKLSVGVVTKTRSGALEYSAPCVTASSPVDASQATSCQWSAVLRQLCGSRAHCFRKHTFTSAKVA